MKLTHLPSEFQKALPILQKIRSAGYEAYFVGGSVRDALLNRPIHDVDIATSSYPEETKRIFKRTVDIGIEHGTAGVSTRDVAVGEEAGVQLAVRIGILAVVPRLVESLQPGRNPELVVVRVFLLHHTIEGSIVPVEDSVPRGI